MKIIYSLVLAAFFWGILFYLTNYALVPYKEEGMLDVRNLAIVSVVLILAIGSVITFLHLLIDKVFFRKFYQKPRLILAVRRGFLLGLLLAGLAWIRIFGFWEVKVVALYILLMILIELLMMAISGGKDKKSKVKNQKSLSNAKVSKIVY